MNGMCCCCMRIDPPRSLLTPLSKREFISGSELITSSDGSEQFPQRILIRFDTSTTNFLKFFWSECIILFAYFYFLFVFIRLFFKRMHLFVVSTNYQANALFKWKEKEEEKKQGNRGMPIGYMWEFRHWIFQWNISDVCALYHRHLGPAGFALIFHFTSFPARLARP